MLEGTTAKLFAGGTHRAVPPEVTWCRIEPLLAHFGITRVANVTGLDRIGIPVVMAIRPNSRALSVSQGKGLSLIAAKVSGAMESIESHHAERASPPLIIARFEDLIHDAAVLDPLTLPRAANSIYSRRLPIPWCEGFDLLGRAPVHVPFELVHASGTLPRLPGSGCFPCTTNGLASGNTLVEAVLHALLEIIERDAIALFDHTLPAAQEALRVDLRTLDEPACRELLARYERANIAVLAWNVTSDLGIPTIRVIICDPSADSDLNPVPSAFGSGTHPTREIAALRALTEAAQSRLTAITGARDDFTRRRYRTMLRSDVIAHNNALAAAAAGGADARLIPSFQGATLEDDLHFVLARLTAAGCTRAVAVDLSQPGLPFSVARAVIPGLEGTTESPNYRAGKRARARIAEGHAR